MARRARRSVSKPPEPQTTVEPDFKAQPLNRIDVAVGAAVAAVTAILYLVTAARDIVLGDTPELITAVLSLGVAHSPGYPLFTMLGYLFGRLPLGPLPFRVDMMAVVCATGAVTLVYFTGLRLSGKRGASAFAALALASTPLFWEWSLA